MRRTARVLVLGAMTWCSAVATLAGEWSSQGRRPAPGRLEARDQTVTCGDVSAVIRGIGLSVVFGGKALPIQVDSKTRRHEIAVPQNVEFLWSPDCNALAITRNEFGTVGGWALEVLAIEHASARVYGLSDQVRAEMMRIGSCVEPQEPNVAAIAWNDGSRTLRVVGEVPNHSSCRNMGQMLGFEIDARTGMISSRLSEADLRVKWKTQLGVYMLRRAQSDVANDGSH